MLDLNETNLVAIAYARVTISQATKFLVLEVARDIKDYKREIEHLKTKVECYKTMKGDTTKFIGYALEIQDNVNKIQRHFYKKLQIFQN